MESVTRVFPDALRERVDSILAAYPTREGALLPLLHLAQDTWGYIDGETIDMLAEIVGVSPARVLGVVTFYTMYHRKPPGRIHLRVCTNVSCMLRGGEEILRSLCRKLGIEPGETIPDGRFSIEEAECLGDCTKAPVVMAGDEYFGPVDEDWIERMLREGAGDD